MLKAPHESPADECRKRRTSLQSMNAESVAGVFQPMNNTDLQKRLCPLFGGHSLCDHLGGACAAPKSGLLLLRSFLLGLLFRFRHVGSPGCRVSPRSEYIHAKQNYKQACAQLSQV